MLPVDCEPSSAAASPTSTWWCPTAFATGGFTFFGGEVANVTLSGAAGWFPGSLTSLAVVANVTTYVVFVLNDLWATMSKSPAVSVRHQENVRPPGLGAIENAAWMDARSTASVKTNQM